MKIRKLFLQILILTPLFGLAQFDLKNNFGVGVNYPMLVASRDYAPFPVVQLDFRHEFYFHTRDPSVMKSFEGRAGLGVMSFLNNSLLMVNIGVQSSFLETTYLQAVGVDLVAYAVQAPSVTKVFDTAGKGMGNGVGIGLFYKIGQKLSKHLSITAELGGLVSIDDYTVSFSGPAWNSGYTPNIGVYRANVSLNYHFGI